MPFTFVRGQIPAGPARFGGPHLRVTQPAMRVSIPIGGERFSLGLMQGSDGSPARGDGPGTQALGAGQWRILRRIE